MTGLDPQIAVDEVCIRLAGAGDEDLIELPARTLLAVLKLLNTARAAAQTAHTNTCPAAATSAFSGQPLECVLPAEPAHDWHRTALGANWSPNVTAAVPAAPAAEAVCGATLCVHDTPHFVCALEPHPGHVHANPGAMAWVLADGKAWAVEKGRVPDPQTGVLRFRDCMGDARMLNAAGALPPDGANWSPNVTAAVPASHGTQPVPDAAERVSAFADAIVQALGADGRLNTASLTGKYGPRVLTAADLLAILAENKQLRADAGEDVRAVAEACAGVVDGTPPQPIRHEYAVRRLRDRFADRIAEFRERDPEFKAERERDNNRCPCGCPKTGPGCDCHWCNEPTNAEAERDGDRHEGGNDA